MARSVPRGSSGAVSVSLCGKSWAHAKRKRLTVVSISLMSVNSKNSACWYSLLESTA